MCVGDAPHTHSVYEPPGFSEQLWLSSEYSHPHFTGIKDFVLVAEYIRLYTFPSPDIGCCLLAPLSSCQLHHGSDHHR